MASSKSETETGSSLFASIRRLIPEAPFDRNNAISVFLMGALPAVAGSAISFMLGAFVVWGFISLRRDRYEFRMTRGDWWLAWAFSVFPLVAVLTAVTQENPGDGLIRALPFLTFLAPWIVISRLRASAGMDYLALYICGAAFGAIAGMALGLLQMAFLDIRPEGGAGNPAVFAMMSLCLAAIAALNISSPKREFRRLAVAGAAAGFVGTLIAIIRGVWLAAVPVGALLFIYSPRAWFRIPLAQQAAVAAFVILIILLFANSGIIGRSADIWWSLEAVITRADYGSSIGERLQMWEAGIAAFLDSPIWGHGVQNRMEVVSTFHPSGLKLDYGHVHNGFLSVAVDGGILLLAAVIAVLAAPILVAATAPADPHYRRRLFMAILISSIYAMSGLSQIMFKHDIMDSFFVFNAILIAASIDPPRSYSARE